MIRALLIGVIVVFLLSACSRADEFVADGALDCESEITWSEQGSVANDALGLPTAEEAVAQYLAPFQSNHGGEVSMVDAATGSLVVERREVVVGVASEAPAGGWLVLTGEGCDGYDRAG